MIGFVEAPRLGLDLPLAIRGTAFQQPVWQAVQPIPPSETSSYSAVAQRIGAPVSVRAAAQACGAHALAIAIPGHRVVRTSFYPHLVPIANRRRKAVGGPVRFPDRHADFIARCHADGQQRPRLCCGSTTGQGNCRRPG